MANDADVIVVGAGLAGLVAANELADAGKRVIVVDQEGEQEILAGRRSGRSAGYFLSIHPNSGGLASRIPMTSLCN
ncbi:FAD-binding dehydrogenase [Streptomyces griseus]